MNVTKQADHNFMEELKRTDRPRYDRLIHAMQKEAYRLQRIGLATQIIRNCGHCGLRLPDGLRADTRFCGATCARNARYAKQGGRASRMAA